MASKDLKSHGFIACALALFGMHLTPEPLFEIHRALVGATTLELLIIEFYFVYYLCKLEHTLDFGYRRLVLGRYLVALKMLVIDFTGRLVLAEQHNDSYEIIIVSFCTTGALAPLILRPLSKPTQTF